MAKINCSELSIQITEIAMNLGSRPDVKNLDDIVARMQAMPELAAIRREDVVTAINEATESKRQTRDALSKKLDEIKREARKDKRLQQAIEDLQNAVDTSRAAAPAPIPAKKATPAAILKLMARKASLERKVSGKSLPMSLVKLAQQMAEQYVAQGVSDREALVDAVHKELSSVDPTLTRRETMDAISGYGQFSELNKDEVKQKLRDFKGQLQQLAKLEDMAQGQAPKKTGVERRQMSDEERRLAQQVNEAKKQGGFEVTDPERQLRTALDAVKKRLKNQIADLQAQIDKGEKNVKTKTPAPKDAETEALTKERDRLKEEYDAIFGQEGLTDAQRIEIAKKAVEKSIAEYQRRLDEGDFAPKQQNKTPETPELKALREKRDKLREKYNAANPVSPEILRARERLAELEQHIKDGTLPTPETREPTNQNPELVKLREAIAEARKAISQSEPAIKKRFEKSIAELTRKLEEGDFIPVVKTPPKLSEELERLEYERDMLRAEIRRRIQDMKPKSVFDRFAEPFNVARSIMTSLDFSAVLRQGGFISFGHPVRSIKNFPAMFNAFVSERATVKIANELLHRPLAPLGARAGLYLSPVDGAYALSAKEEAYMSRWAEKIPLVRGSERAYVTFLNKLRADTFDAMVRTLGRNGEVTQEEAEAIAKYVNVATGRGGLWKLEQAAVPMATLFFSPRLVASRFQLLLGQPLYGGSARTRKLVAQEYARFLIGVGVVYALALAAGADIEEDPRSTDFGKIRFGQTRLDPLVGLSQVTAVLARTVTGEAKSPVTEKVSVLRGEDRAWGKSVYTEWTSFLRKKLSPMVGTIVNVSTGENVIGENTDVTTKEGATRVVTSLTIPMSFRDIYDAMQDQGVARGTAVGILSIFGMSVNVFPYEGGDGETDESKK